MGRGAQSSSASGFQGFPTLCKPSARTIYGKTKCKAFTLAEVLITLGIIGVVAAMTLPALIQSYKKQVVETKLAKFYSVMNNAIRMAEAEYGPQSTWTEYHIGSGEFNSETQQYPYDKGNNIDERVRKYFAPYLKITGSEEFYDIPVIDKGLNQPQKIYYLSDGSAFSFGLHENREIFFYPSNPKKCLMTENPDGRCRFVFAFVPFDNTNGKVGNWFKYQIGKGIQPYVANWDGKESSLTTNTAWGCNKNSRGTYCTAVIQRNGWKIPKDYPFKF